MWQATGVEASVKQRWNMVRSIEKDYAPNAFTRIGVDGAVLETGAKLEASADYLAGTRF